MKRQALIVYDGLPIPAGGAHSLGRRNVTDICYDLERFLLDCTDHPKPSDIQLTLYEGQSIPSDFRRAIKDSLTPVYGKPSRRQVASGEGADLWEETWIIAPAQLRSAAQWLASRLPLPKPHSFAGPPLILGVEATFKLRDPRSDELLSFQGREYYGDQEYGFRMPLGLSRLYSRLSEPSTWSLFLSLPFTEVSEDLLHYVATLQKYLPFKFSPKHWTRWQLNAKGTRYYSRKVRVV